jgi:tRNA C32,U32 (ribose-2'-O)-methylase TrmJ
VSIEDRPAGGEEIAEMHRILRKVLEREELSETEVEFLHGLRINALDHFLDGR